MYALGGARLLDTNPRYEPIRIHGVNGLYEWMLQHSLGASTTASPNCKL